MSGTQVNLTQIDEAQIEKFVWGQIDDSVESVRSIARGEHSLTFEVINPEGSKVIRLSEEVDNFHKDKLAAKRFSSEDVVIPEVEIVGRFADGVHYAISKKARGTNVAKLPESEYITLLPEMMRTLASIHSHELPAGTKFGNWSHTEEPQYPSWREHIEASLKKRTPIGNDFSQQETIQSWIETVRKGLDYAPDSPVVCHGDYWAGNLFCADGKISDVIDWPASFLGDQMFDLGERYYREFTRTNGKVDILDLYLENGGEEVLIGDHPRERLKAGLCYWALGALCYHTKNGSDHEIIEHLITGVNNLLAKD